MIGNTHFEGNNRNKLLFLLSYLTGAVNSWAQSINKKLFEGTCLEYDLLTQNFETMFFDTREKEI